VFGAILGMISGAILTTFLSNKSIRRLIVPSNVHLGDLNIREYVIASVIFSLCLGFLVNMDVFMARYFFDERQAGFFAAASVIAKVSFFISIGIVTVNFPKVAELHANGKRTIKILKSSLKYVLISSISLSLVYFLFPGFISYVFYGPEYDIASLIGWYGLAMSLLSVVNILMMYHLAQRRFNVVWVLGFFTMFEFVLIILFHSTALRMISAILFSTLLFFIVMIYVSRDQIREAFTRNNIIRKYPLSFYLNLKNRK